MRICSFLPSAREMLYALGLGGSVAGITYECDYPPEARAKPVVVNTRLTPSSSAGEIDRVAYDLYGFTAEEIALVEAANA